VKLVVPDYSEKVLLFTTHPIQFEVEMQQSSFELSQFSFHKGPFYIEDYIAEVIEGENVYRCANHNCGRVFVRSKPVPKKQPPFCANCYAQRFGAAKRRPPGKSG
jgi:hypothetical protein